MLLLCVGSSFHLYDTSNGELGNCKYIISIWVRISAGEDEICVEMMGAIHPECTLRVGDFENETMVVSNFS